MEPTLSKLTLPPELFISVAIEADKLVNEPVIVVALRAVVPAMSAAILAETDVNEPVIRFHFSREMVFKRCRCDFSLTDHVLSIPHYRTNGTNEFIFWGWFFVRMSNENEVVFRPDNLIDDFFWGRISV